MNNNFNNTDNDENDKNVTMDFLLKSQTSVNNSQDVNMEQNINNNLSPNSNNKKVLPIILIILAVTGIVIACIFLFNKDSNDINNNSGIENNESNKEKMIWDGVYKNSNGVIYLHQVDDENLDFVVNLKDRHISGTAEIKDNKAELDIFSVYTFELSDNKLTFSSSDEEIGSTIYTKTSDYGIDDYYKDYYGNPEYLKSEINGVFEKDDMIIKIWQQNEMTVGIYIVSKNKYFTRSERLEFIAGALIYEDFSFGEKEKINANINGNKLIISASSTDEEDLLNKISGTYTKVKNYTLEEIINDNI